MRISEVYASCQCEGPRTGLPTQFVRFGGCNLRCAGWPCDTQYAIDPQYRHDWQVVTPEELFDEWIQDYPKNICLTGGEPFLQNNKELGIFVRMLRANGYTVEAFTNGDVIWPDWAVSVDFVAPNGPINFVMDWKLPGSGEKTHTPIRLMNFASMTMNDVVKFTIKDDADFQAAIDIWNEDLKDRHLGPMVYAGPVWDGKLTAEQIVGEILDLQLPWHLNVQVHKYIWPSDKRGV